MAENIERPPELQGDMLIQKSPKKDGTLNPHQSKQLTTQCIEL